VRTLSRRSAYGPSYGGRRHGPVTVARDVGGRSYRLPMSTSKETIAFLLAQLEPLDMRCFERC